MALTKEDLAKIEAMVTALFRAFSARLERKIDQRISLLEQSLMAEIHKLSNDLEAVKAMLTEDVAGAYERIDELETRVKKLEGQVAALA